jgi:hypothetical protein
MLFFPTDGCAMDRAVSSRLFTAKARFQSLAGLCEVYGAKTTLEQVFFRALQFYPVSTIPLLFT